MTKSKPGFVRIGCDIPEDLHSRIKEYNKNSVNPLNMSRVMIQAIENEVAKIKAAEEVIEGTTLVDENNVKIICADGNPYTIKDLMVLNDAEVGLHDKTTAMEAVAKVKEELQKLQNCGNENITRILREGVKESFFTVEFHSSYIPDSPEVMEEIAELMRKIINVFMYLSAYNKIHYTKFPN